jgi:hypothetical protein
MIRFCPENWGDQIPEIWNLHAENDDVERKNGDK